MKAILTTGTLLGLILLVTMPQAAIAQTRHDASAESPLQATAVLNDRSCAFQKVIGGFCADPGELSWMVGFRRKDKGGIHCGGVLLSDEWVLTARHCAVAGGDVAVLGKVDNGVPDEEVGQEHLRVECVIDHPEFDGEAYLDSDVSLVKLEQASQMEPVALPDPASGLPGKVTVAGWGWGAADSEPPRQVLAWATIPVWSTDRCEKAYDTFSVHGFRKTRLDSRHDEYKITDKMFCAGTPTATACKGDSGGPLVDVPSDGSPPRLVGIVNFRRGACGEFGHVNARVSKFRTWIDSALSDALDDECK